VRLISLRYYRSACLGCLFLLLSVSVLASAVSTSVTGHDEAVTIELSWQGSTASELWLMAPSGEIIRPTHPFGETLPVWLEQTDASEHSAVRQRLHIDHQLAPGDYRIALQLVAEAAEEAVDASGVRFQLTMRQYGRVIRQLNGRLRNNSERQNSPDIIWRLNAAEHWNSNLPLALLREQFQGVWQLQSAEQTRVYIRLQGQSMELQVYEYSECQWLALQDAVTLPGGLRWQQEQLWLHTAFFSDLLYGAVGEDEFLPMQQASWPEGECEGMSF
jgi:hypothetical protein